MANTFYITAGLPPNDSGETTAANTFYISAGLVPDDAAGTTPTYSFKLTDDGLVNAGLTQQRLVS